MRQITEDEIPTDGSNFVSLHEFEGNVWATTYRFNIAKNHFEIYNEGFDGEELEWSESWTVAFVPNTKFYIA